MCEKYLYLTTTKGDEVRHERMHIDCQSVEVYENDQWRLQV